MSSAVSPAWGINITMFQYVLTENHVVMTDVYSYCGYIIIYKDFEMTIVKIHFLQILLYIIILSLGSLSNTLKGINITLTLFVIFTFAP